MKFTKKLKKKISYFICFKIIFKGYLRVSCLMNVESMSRQCLRLLRHGRLFNKNVGTSNVRLTVLIN